MAGKDRRSGNKDNNIHRKNITLTVTALKKKHFLNICCHFHYSNSVFMDRADVMYMFLTFCGNTSA